MRSHSDSHWIVCDGGYWALVTWGVRTLFKSAHIRLFPISSSTNQGALME